MAEVIEIQILDETTKERVLESGRRLRTNAGPLRKVSMEVGWDGAFIQSLADKGSWAVFECGDQHDFRRSIGIGRSNWYRLTAIAENFLSIDRDVYLAMTIENAELLGKQEPAIRLDPVNLKKAAELTYREFKDELVTAKAHREGRPPRERWTTFEMPMKEEQFKVITQRLAGWKEEHEIDNDAYALELLIVEYSERPTLAGFILDSIHSLTKHVRENQDPDELRGLIGDHVKAMYDILGQCCGDVEEEVA